MKFEQYIPCSKVKIKFYSNCEEIYIKKLPTVSKQVAVLFALSSVKCRCALIYAGDIFLYICGQNLILALSSVQSLSRVRLFATPWITARQASLSITISQSSLKLRSIELVMPSSHLILCHPLFLLPPIPPSIRVFSSESALRMRWPKYWSFSFSIIPNVCVWWVIFLAAQSRSSTDGLATKTKFWISDFKYITKTCFKRNLY